MRTNLPVTGNERFLEEGEFILSKADLKGNITYINRTFIEMSGFTEAELAGQPHNIVRHPDMPPEAFRDFWSTLKAGKSWSGLVKNRCKNGDHYWVQANASPIWQNGTMIGYMSVRTRPERKLVEQTEADPITRAAGSPERSRAICVITSTGFEATSRIASGATARTWPITSAKTSRLRVRSERRLSPGFCATPQARMTTAAPRSAS